MAAMSIEKSCNHILICVYIVNWKRSDWTYMEKKLYIIPKFNETQRSEYHTTTEECKFGNVHM